MKKISAIIVTYNRLNLLKETLKNLLNQDYRLNSIFVVNNNSSDDTKKFLFNYSHQHNIIKPINMTKNLGGAGGFSIGTKIAFEKSNSNYFWLMDDDTLPTKSASYYLVNTAKNLHDKFGYLCSYVKWRNTEEPSYMNVPVASTDWNYKLYKGLIKTISASFVSLFITRNVVHKFGLPIADMFIWGDDVEYTTRLSRKYDSYLVPHSVVMHESKSNFLNESVFNVPLNRLIYYKCMFRNRLYISRKYYKIKRTFKLFIEYFIILIKIPFCAKHNKVKRMVYTFLGIINGLVFNPEIKFPSYRTK